MKIFNDKAFRKYIVCQGFYLTSPLETVRTRSGHLGWDATLTILICCAFGKTVKRNKRRLQFVRLTILERLTKTL